MIRREPYTQDADIWSSGVPLHSMTTAMLPFDDDVPLVSVTVRCSANVRRTRSSIRT
jgi:serine/threonine protein kinase